MLAKTPWPDWSGEVLAIVASGPSLKNENLDLLRGRVKVVAIKQSYDRCSFADAVYGCDDAWWRHRRGLPEFKGMKYSWGDKACAEFPDIRKIEIKDNLCDRLLFDEVGTVGAGGNSGFQALNLVVQFGAKPLLLLGFDMNDHALQHWYGRNNWPKANNPDHLNFGRWRAAFTAASMQLKNIGIDVVNCSPVSSLKCFRRDTLANALSRWGV